MVSRRTKSIGMKVTPEEYARIQTPVSEWVRAALFKAAEPPAADATVLAEVPKSVSLTALVGGDDRVRDAHR